MLSLGTQGRARNTGNEPVKQLFPTPPVIASHGNACGQPMTYGNISGGKAPTSTQHNNVVFASKRKRTIRIGSRDIQGVSRTHCGRIEKSVYQYLGFGMEIEAALEDETKVGLSVDPTWYR